MTFLTQTYITCDIWGQHVFTGGGGGGGKTIRTELLWKNFRENKLVLSNFFENKIDISWFTKKWHFDTNFHNLWYLKSYAQSTALLDVFIIFPLLVLYQDRQSAWWHRLQLPEYFVLSVSYANYGQLFNLNPTRASKFKFWRTSERKSGSCSQMPTMCKSAIPGSIQLLGRS